ncbi:FAD-dependent thymidylate synthase [Nocardia cyriacigeorgica]|uniref:FAD-dependent thymidylate synthase n=1 Tax=Nocardia cyriacigeorgica TaxID=135487 RepID=UPI0018945671|nr:FAD-dependent thymidylate synthase [Nocardia cyriacigeorgica]MBF6428664.1 FAD-dependent thymidylate synthase [Nocardia cyriacigeorgica]
MRVELIAKTEIDFTALSGIGYDVHTVDDFEPLGSGRYFTEEDADELAEFAGRNCYRSFHRPNPATRENLDYLAHILEVGHESVLEHASATFYIEASRSVLTELERHRHLSFSVVSQRYVDMSEAAYHTPPVLRDHSEYAEILADVWDMARQGYEILVDELTEAGFSRKQSREAARAVLPNMTNSPMVVTGNHRAWRYVIKNRWHEAADAEIRELAGELLRQLREIAPNTYQDVPDKPYSY